MRKACGISLALLRITPSSRASGLFARLFLGDDKVSKRIGLQTLKAKVRSWQTSRDGSEKHEADRKVERRALESGFLHGVRRQGKAPAGAFFFACSLMALAGCTTVDRHSVLPPVTAKIPASLKLACAGPVVIPERDLTEADVARLWATDRKALLICARRHGSLAKAASVLEAGK